MIDVSKIEKHRRKADKTSDFLVPKTKSENFSKIF